MIRVSFLYDVFQAYVPTKERNRIPAQDRGYIVNENNGIISMALCDGAGSQNMSGEGAGEVSKLIAEMINNNWEQYKKAFPSEVRKEIYIAIKLKLKELSQLYNCNQDDFGSTVVALATDGEICIGIHLGDGAIISKDKDTIKILSYPVNGVVKEATYLTTSRYAYDNIRFYRFERSDSQYMLITDGICWWDKKLIKNLLDSADEKKMISIISDSQSDDDASTIMFKIQEDKVYGNDN